MAFLLPKRQKGGEWKKERLGNCNIAIEIYFKNEPVSKCSISKSPLICSRSRKAKILTTGIHVVFRGLKFEPDADIGQKGTF